MQSSTKISLGPTVLLVVAACVIPTAAPAQSEQRASGIRIIPAPSPSEGQALIGKLQALQQELKRGENPYFDLLAGAPASFPLAAVPPRELFLELPFDQAFHILRERTDKAVKAAYRLMVPHPAGKLMCHVEAVVGFYDEIERVEILCRPPPPLTPSPPPPAKN